MSTLKLDSDGDLALENNSFVLLSDTLLETRQRLMTKFKFFLGEWFLDARVGFPHFQEVLVKNPDFTLIEDYGRELILNDEQVDTLESFVLGHDNSERLLTLSFEAVLLSGEVLTFNDFILGAFR